MRCPKCGKDIANDSVYCEFCGVYLGNKKDASKLLLITLCVVSTLVVIIYTCFIFYTSETELSQKDETTLVEVSDSENAKLQCKVDSLTNEINHLKEMLRDKEVHDNQLKSLKSEIESLKNHNTSLQAKLKRYKELFNN